MTINTGSSTSGPSTIPFSQENTFALNQVLMFDTTLNAFVNTTLPTGGTTGEINTGSNIGAGQQVFKDKLGTAMRFRSIVAGAGIAVTSDTDEIFIATTGTGSGDITGGTSTGSGNAIFRDKSGANLRFRSLTAGTNVTLTQNADDIVVNAGTNALTLNSIADTGYVKVANNLSDVTAATARTNLAISSTAEADAKYLHLDTSKAPAADGATSLGTGVKRFNNIYAVAFKGNADTATTATNLAGFTPGNYVAKAGGTMSGTLVLSGAPTANLHAATKVYVDTAIANTINAAPGVLNTLNELAAAIGDDANFSTTITNSIATKLPLAGGTLTGALVLSGAPTIALHAATKAYVDAGDGLQLTKASNLSDLANAATARTNLGLGTAATTASGAYLAAGTLTTGVAEGTNKYYTDARVMAVIGGINTANLSEGTNLYFTTARAKAAAVADAIANGVTDVAPSQNAVFDALALKEGTITAAANTTYYRGDKTFQTLNTSAVAEGTNLYYTNARADARITAASLTSHTNVDSPGASDNGKVLYYNHATTSFKWKVDASTPAGYNNANWDTAFGWGNHGAAGYLTTIAANAVNDTHIDWGTGSNQVSTADIPEATNLYYTQARFDSALTAKSTTNLSEGTNLYFTNARADARITAADTGDLSEGSNLYFTNARADARIGAAQLSALANVHTAAPTDGQILKWVNANSRWEPASHSTLIGVNEINDTHIDWGTGANQVNTADIPEVTNLYYTDARANSAFDTRLATKTTANLAENTNLYFTNARADARADVRIAAANINALANVHTAAPTDGQVLKWDNGNSRWAPAADTDTVYSSFNADFDTRLATKTTANLAENTNLYFTNARADARIVAAGSANWNTAFGWGNHGAAGYLTAITAQSLTSLSNVDAVVAGDNGKVLYYNHATTSFKWKADDDTPAGYNNTNWDTAYGYGNHASAGYLTSIAANSINDTHIDWGTGSNQVSTADIPENTNLYYTNARVDAYINASITTADVSEGSNLYYTNARADARIGAAALSALSNVHTAAPTDGQVLKWDNGNSRWAPATDTTVIAANAINDTHIDWGTGTNQVSTADIPENTNLYYTDARADARAQLKIDSLIDSAPGALNTLNELAASLGDDANFAGTMTASLASKEPTLAAGLATQYYKGNKTWALLNTAAVPEHTNLYYTNARADARVALATGANLNLSAKTTAHLPEGSNLYFTNARADARITAAVGTTVQGLDADLTAIGALAKTDGNFIVGNGTTWVAENAATARASLGLGTMATALTSVYYTKTETDARFANVVGTGANLADIADAAAARTNLGLGSAAVANTTAFADPTLSNLSNAVTARANLGTIGFAEGDARYVRYDVNYLPTVDNTVVLGDTTKRFNTIYARQFKGQMAGTFDNTMSTDDLLEGSSNLYFTNARARAAISESSTQLAYNNSTGVLTFTQGNTDTVAEGSSNLYFTNARADARITNALKDEDDMTSNSATHVPSQQSVKAYVDAQTTSETAEGSNLYFTNARADARIAASSLTTLSNVDTVSASDDDKILYYDHGTTSFKWKTEGGHTSTSTLTEGTNLYFTNARADARIAAASLTDLSNVNLTSHAANDVIHWNGTAWVNLQLTTSTVGEGTNQYYTDARVDTRVGTKSVDILSDVDTTTTAPTNSQVLTWNASSSKWVPATPPGSSGGEANTGANVGSAGVGIFDAKVGTALNFKKLNSLDANLTITDDAANDKVDLDLSNDIMLISQNLTGVTVATARTNLGLGESDSPIFGGVGSGFMNVQATPSAGPVAPTSAAISLVNMPVPSGSGHKWVANHEGDGDLTFSYYTINDAGANTSSAETYLRFDTTGTKYVSIAGTGIRTYINGLYYPQADGTANQVLKTDGAGALGWTNAGGVGTVTSITAGTGLTGGTITSTGTIAVDVGTTANKIVQLDGSAKLPAVDGSQLTGVVSTLTALTDVDAVVAGDDAKVLYYNHATTSFKWKVDDDTPAGYNNTNWDTAFGWGNHASGGYLTSIAADSIKDTMIDWGTGANQVSTADIPEQTNLYYTDARADARAQLKVDALIASAPGALDTLNELAAAIGDDANFSTTMTNSLAGKEPTITAAANTTYYRGDKTFQTLNTTAVAEGTNLYYTNARADARIGAANINALANVHTAAPTDGQVLKWVNANSRWEPSADTGLTTEQVQDISGAMFTGNTETLITATYQDGDGTIDLVVDNNLANYSNASSGFLTSIAANSINDTHIDWGTGANQVSTADVPEQTNLYYTDARADARITNAGSANWNTAFGWGNHASGGYLTSIAANSINDTHIDWGTGSNQVSTADVPEQTNLYYTDARADARIAAADTGDLSEGSNLYFTNARADARIGAASITALSNVHTTAPTDGQILAWDNSNSRYRPITASGTGTVTSITAGTGLTGGTITASGTVAVDVGTTANKIVQLDGSARLPAVDGSQLTNIAHVPAGYNNSNWDTAYGWGNHASGGYLTSIAANSINDTHIDWGTGSNQVSTADVPEQTNLYYTDARADARIGAAALSALSNVHTAAPTDGQVLKWDNGNSRWAPATDAGGMANIVEDTTPQLGGTLDANGNTIDMGTNVITDAKVGNYDTAVATMPNWNQAYVWANAGHTNWDTAYTHSQAAHAPSGAEVNQNAFTTVAVSGQTDVVADTKTDTLTLVAGSNVTLTTTPGTDSVTIAASGGGGSQNVFSTIAVSGQSNVVADATTDTLTLAAGSNMTITTNAGSDTITFASSGGGGGGTVDYEEFKCNYHTNGTLLAATNLSSGISGVTIDSASGGDVTVTFTGYTTPPIGIMFYGYGYASNVYNMNTLGSTGTTLRELPGGGSSGSPTAFGSFSTLKLKIRETETGASRSFGTTTHAWIRFVMGA